MIISFVLGNGQSRREINLGQLREHGKIYGCNALYREFTPDVLVATDLPIATAIQESGYALKNKFHTRRPIEGQGALKVDKRYHGFSSGPNALGLACVDGAHRIYMLGFDLGSTSGKFNNVYADSQFYKKSSEPPTFSGNWVKQVKKICDDYPDVQFIRVEGLESAFVPDLANVKNFKHLPITDFQTLLNSKEGRL